MPADADAGPFTPGTDPVLLDHMLGKLAVYLRMCGYDGAYAGDRGAESDAALQAIARSEGRVLLSRDRTLVTQVPRSVLLTERDVAAQLDELRAAGFELSLPEQPTRCGRCNGRLDAVPADADRPDYAPASSEFTCWRCVDCGQYFWKGSHWDRVRSLL
ncbi:MAG: Mut7-C RNAse domain-containing protein [Halobacteriales archaeon]